MSRLTGKVGIVTGGCYGISILINPFMERYP